MKRSSTKNKLSGSVIAIIALTVCFAITTLALAYSIISVDENIFRMGSVDIDLNGGESIINDSSLAVEPGMTVKKDFFIQNNSTCSVYYKLYFQNISGSLAELMNIKICDGDKVLYSGALNSFTKDSTSAADDILNVGEKKELQIYFHLPKNTGNTAQGTSLYFDFAAQAVQTANNPDKSFD